MSVNINLLLLCFTSVLLSRCFSFSSVRYQQRSRHLARSPLFMNLFQRFTKVVSSNVNQFVNSLEDPEKILDQAVDDMQKDLVKIR